jgi:hypothetical protein
LTSLAVLEISHLFASRAAVVRRLKLFRYTPTPNQTTNVMAFRPGSEINVAALEPHTFHMELPDDDDALEEVKVKGTFFLPATVATALRCGVEMVATALRCGAIRSGQR